MCFERVASEECGVPSIPPPPPKKKAFLARESWRQQEEVSIFRDIDVVIRC